MAPYLKDVNRRLHVLLNEIREKVLKGDREIVSQKDVIAIEVGSHELTRKKRKLKINYKTAEMDLLQLINTLQSAQNDSILRNVSIIWLTNPSAPGRHRTWSKGTMRNRNAFDMGAFAALGVKHVREKLTGVYVVDFYTVTDTFNNNNVCGLHYLCPQGTDGEHFKGTIGRLAGDYLATSICEAMRPKSS